MSTYVYGMIPEGHPSKVDDLTGVGDPPGAVRTVPAGDVKAVVGDVAGELRPKRRDVKAHEDVLEALCEQGAVLPMRFGVVADSDAAVAREISAREAEYRATLSELDNRVEINVKVAHQQDMVLAALLREDSELAGVNEDLRARGGGSQDEQVRFGELVTQALAERQRRDAAVIVAMLGEHAVRDSSGPPVDGCFVNTSFLVDRSEIDAFTEVVERLRSTLGELAEVRLSGPLPPYSFVGGA